MPVTVPAWGQPAPVHLPALARKVLLALRGSRGSGEWEEMENMHTSISANQGSQGQRLFVGRKKNGREDGEREGKEEHCFEGRSL